MELYTVGVWEQLSFSQFSSMFQKVVGMPVTSYLNSKLIHFFLTYDLFEIFHENKICLKNPLSTVYCHAHHSYALASLLRRILRREGSISSEFAADCLNSWCPGYPAPILDQLDDACNYLEGYGIQRLADNYGRICGFNGILKVKEQDTTKVNQLEAELQNKSTIISVLQHNYNYQSQETNKLNGFLQEKTELCNAMNTKLRELEKKVEVFMDQRLCVVCLSKERAVLLNCGHFIVCTTCGDRVTTCPVCKVQVIGKFKVFVS